MYDDAKVLKWADIYGHGTSCTNWFNRLRKRFKIAGIQEYVVMDASIVCKSFVQSTLRESLQQPFLEQCYRDLRKDTTSKTVTNIGIHINHML
jgi:hypothetical protein